MDVLHISIMVFILVLTETSNYKKSGHNVKHVVVGYRG